MKTVIGALKTTVLLAVVLALTTVLARGIKADAAYKDKVTTPEGLILQEDDGQITGKFYRIVGCTDKLYQDLVIPEEYNGLPITYIDAKSFMNNTGLKSVVIPPSIYSIGKNAFKGCTSLARVDFTGDAHEWRQNRYPDMHNIEALGLSTGVFEDCISLRSLELNYGVNIWASDDIIKNSGIRYLKVVVRDTYGGRAPNGEFNNAPELEKFDIILKNAHTNSSCFDIGQNGNWPKLKEINVYQEQGEDFKNMASVSISESSGVLEKRPISSCPLLEYINVYVTAGNAIGRQFISFNSIKGYETEFEGENVRRLNDKGDTFVVDAEGTAVFSCAKASFKVRLTVGGEASTKKNISECKLTIPVKELIYTGTARVPYLYLLDGKTVLEEDKDYTVSAKNNTEIGTATVTIEGIGDYTGTVSETFSVVPVRTDVKSVKIGKKESTIVLNDNKQADGYQIYYSSKKSKGYKKLYSGTDTKAKVTGLKSGMYIKVRTYKKVGKTTYYSEWSAPVQVK